MKSEIKKKDHVWISFKAPKDLVDRLKQESRQTDVTVSQMLRAMLKTLLPASREKRS